VDVGDCQRSEEGCVMENDDNKKVETSKKKHSNKFLDYMIWWKINPEELANEIVNYDKLGWKSARRTSCLFLLYAAVATIGFSFLQKTEIAALVIDVSLLCLLAGATYTGFRWASILAMAVWTLEKGLMAVQHPSTLIQQYIFWSIFMHMFWMSYKVGRNPRLPGTSPENNAGRESA
jgi:hypothetical protein